ncbi:alpha/beta fold hydrolase [Minwuia sp.]|uniref:alpha/beta fold hydrolase n=1 Tax=Minwuia sp. TaxID=2493630 RepID=UPI003A8E5C65
MSNWRESAPDWFIQAVDSPWEQRFAESGGAKIHYRVRGEEGAPGIVLCHGNAAHSGWWDFIAPALAEDYRVAALDFAGMGDSEERQLVTPDGFANDIVAVIRDMGFDSPPLLIGHSFGGGMSMRVAVDHPDLIRGLVMVDSPVYRPDTDRPGPPRVAKRAYPSMEIALERFRLIPEQPVVTPYAVAYIAETGVMETRKGWTWKARTNIFGHPAFAKHFWEEQAGYFPRIEIPATKLWGSLSALCTPETMAFMQEIAPSHVTFVEMEDAYHHLLLDRPQETIRVLKEIAAT